VLVVACKRLNNYKSIYYVNLKIISFLMCFID